MNCIISFILFIIFICKSHDFIIQTITSLNVLGDRAI